MTESTHIHTYRCAICGRIKGEVNHWRMVWWGLRDGVSMFLDAAWDEEIAADPKTMHVCGQGCALAAHERYLDGGPMTDNDNRAAAVDPQQEVA